MSRNDRTPETRPSLILRLKNSDDMLAWQEFVEIYQPLIYSLAVQRGLQKADADDVSQEVMSRIARHIEKWNPDHERASFRGWLATITRNETLLFFRKHGRRPMTGKDSTFGQLSIELKESEFDLERDRQIFAWASQNVQGRFDNKNWQAFWLTAVEEQPVSKVAQQLQISKAQVYVARSRVMAALKNEVEQTEFDSRVDWRIS